MNANELADAMQGVISVLNVHHEEDCLFIANDAQYMLRQQQAEIETYKLELYNEVMLRREQNNVYKQQIENMGLAIADSGYTWTPAMRSAWEALDKEPK